MRRSIMGIIGRITGSGFAILLSFILAIFLLVVLGLQAPELLTQTLNAADWVESQVTNLGLPNEYNNWIRLFIDDTQLVMIFFVIVIRVLLTFITSGIKAIFSGGDDY
ncbi:MAG: hypothetical protein COA60_001040 [Robiginitomaculum sp.]|nr:hypothetical protein [Robiginitomaculum sp.]